jgi:hypothetical protein
MPHLRLLSTALLLQSSAVLLSVLVGCSLAPRSASPSSSELSVDARLEALSALAQDPAEQPAAPREGTNPAQSNEAAEVDSDPGPRTLLGQGGIGKAYDDLVAEKNDVFPLTVGAWHWFNLDLTGNDNGGYGTEALPGTYFWYARFSPKLEFEDGPIQAIGSESEFRIRDDGPFRDWFDDNWWFYEANLYAKTDIGKFEGGKILNRFGLPWDGTFWGNTPYFDGWKLDPDWGIGWSHELALDEDLTVETSAQFFIHDDHVNGSISGGDAESFPQASERNTVVARVAPKYRFDEETTLLLGLSGTYGHVDYSDNSPVRDQYIKATAVDVQFGWRSLNLFGEWVYSDGVRNPAHYISGGPSTRVDNYLLGGTYRWDWVTLRCTFSTGHAENPDGKQVLWVPAVTLHLTKNVDFYLEYVDWAVSPAAGPRIDFEEGIQFVLNWRF